MPCATILKIKWTVCDQVYQGHFSFTAAVYTVGSKVINAIYVPQQQ